MQTIATKKDEIITKATTSTKMYGQYLAKSVIRKWNDEFVDEKTGEIKNIERSELIENKGTYLDNDTIPQILFHIEAGDIESVLVSNQKRVAELILTRMMLWFVTARIGKRPHKFLVHANSVQMALEVTRDHIELNFSDSFSFTQVKDNSNCIAIEDKLTMLEEMESKDRKFYKIEVNVLFEDEAESSYTFIVLSVDVDSAMIVINNTITERAKEQEEDREYTTTLESAVTIPCDYLIEKEFSMVYAK